MTLYYDTLPNLFDKKCLRLDMITDLIVMTAAQCPLYKTTTANSYVRPTLQVWGRLRWRAAGTPVLMEGCPRECQTARRVNHSDLRQWWVPYFHTECKIRAGKCRKKQTRTRTAAARARKRRRPQSFLQPTVFFEHAKQKLWWSTSSASVWGQDKPVTKNYTTTLLNRPHPPTRS